MNQATSKQEQPLRAQIGDAQEKLGALEQRLHSIDGELEGLAVQREQYELLAHACGSLEKLNVLGAAELFWGENADRGKAAEHVGKIRRRVDDFCTQLAEIEGRRQAVVDEILEGQEVLAILEDDLLEQEEEEEERRNEWLLEREMRPVAERTPVMPWTRGGEDDRRLRKSFSSSLAAALLVGLLLPLIDLPVPEPSEALDVPERLVRLIRQERAPVAPPPPTVAEEPVPEERPIPEPEPEPLLAEQPPQPVETPVPQEEPPRQRAESSGILAFRESFSTLAENRPSARLGSDARLRDPGNTTTGRPERAMVTTQAPGSSGGINLAALSRDVAGGGGGAQIGGVETTRVASSIGTGGGADRPLAGSSASAGRTDEEIQIVFDRHKAALYRLYNRELRRDPTLRGQMVLRLTIEPDGTVSLCDLQSTDMNAPELVQQVLERVRTFDFGAKDVPPVTISYPIDFLPVA